MEIGTIVLSGGKSSRFGTDKGLYLFNDKHLVNYAFKSCQPFSKNTIIISNNEKYQSFQQKVYPDIFISSGPMGGIHSGLHHSTYDINLIISCDTPYISSGLIKMMLQEYSNEDVLICQTSDGKYQTLIGLYHKRIIKKMEHELKLKHLKLIDFIFETNHKIIQIPKDHLFNKCFINFNYLSEAKKYEY
ncbi:MAG: NTP transferase domain-containing protein [Bacteroidales bacterium]|nr:NTP transferase domain-containing protein [Bacteroidales bacterium]